MAVHVYEEKDFLPGFGVLTIALAGDPDGNGWLSFSGLHFDGIDNLYHVTDKEYADALNEAIRDAVSRTNDRMAAEDRFLPPHARPRVGIWLPACMAAPTS